VSILETEILVMGECIEWLLFIHRTWTNRKVDFTILFSGPNVTRVSPN